MLGYLGRSRKPTWNVNKVSKPFVTGTGKEYHSAPAFEGSDGVRRALTRHRRSSASGDDSALSLCPNAA